MSAAIIPGTRPEIIKMSTVIRECERRGMEYFIHRKGRKAQMHNSLNSEEIIRTGTRIFTDPGVSVSSASSAQSVFYRTPPIIDNDKKPQMNADKRRLIALFHREERKAQMHHLMGRMT